MSLFRKSNVPNKAVNWKTNLAALWLSQLLSLAGFYFCLPFLPLYLKEYRIVPPENVAFWSGIYLAAAPVSMMIMSPIWGALGDRYGRKMMLVRATLAGAFVLYLSGVVDNIESLIVLRLLQGAFTGTIQAAQTLVAAHTPNRNQGFAIGFLMAAVNAGMMAGPYFGGVCAKYFGAAATFKAGGVMLLFATILVVVIVREDFIRPDKLPVASRSARLRRRQQSITGLVTGLPILLAIGLVAFLQNYDAPFISLYVDALHRADLADTLAVMPDAETIQGQVYDLTGRITALAGFTAVAGSMLVGMIMDRKFPRGIWLVIAVATTLGILWVRREPTLLGLASGRSFFLFFINGMASALIILLSRMTPNSRHGAALGWSVTARSIGWMLAPLCGAAASYHLGFGNAYVILALVSLFLIPMFLYLTGRYQQAFKPDR